MKRWGSHSFSDTHSLRADPTNSTLNLTEILTTLTHLREVLKTHVVKDKLILKVIDEHKCKPENFCKVEKVLSGIDHDEFREKGKLVRQLKEYNGKQRNCSIEESTEVPLFVVLRHLHTCIQKKYSHN
ncbi:hypothetical protein COCON_G00079960 [Conger conger]|uniref:Uncharacterized protein n=1 Tax=Conger conger TaxID=82655 RepID=A0A9Q1I0T1_CONCO|nr:hypothetical protein COCON_G00079960 [Conger conger]